MSRIVALVDGSIYSNSVCDHAAWVAKRIRASVDLVHVLGHRDGPTESANLSGSIGFDATSTLLEELVEDDAQKARLAHVRGREILDNARNRIAEAGVVSIVTKLRNGELVESLEDLELDADLIVIGKRGEAADFDKLQLGSNLERVVRSSGRPVLVASRVFKPVERFLIAFDGGASATRAVEHLARFGMLADLDCQLLTIGKESGQTAKQLEDAAALLRDAGYRVQTEIQPGQAERIIAGKIGTDGFNLLVMGAYGHSRIRNLIIGSTTTEMVRSCIAPVLLFR